MCNISHLKFPCKICARNVHGKDKAVKCDICEFRVHIKCNNHNYLDNRFFSKLMNPGIVWNVPAQFFLSTPYQVTKTSWLVVPVLIVTSYSGKI